MVAEAVRTRTFVPQEPASLQRAGLTDSEVEGLILKFLAARGDASGFAISEQIKLPYPWPSTASPGSRTPGSSATAGRRA